MSLTARLRKLEARFGIQAPVDLAALLRQGADAATLRAGMLELLRRGRLRADDFPIMLDHPAFAADRAQARAELREAHRARWPVDPLPANLDDAGDPGRPFRR